MQTTASATDNARRSRQRVVFAATRGARTWLLAALICAPWLILLARRCLNLDLWYDEVFTLDHFVFQHLRTTLTDYSLPNNHVFFNLLNNLYATCARLPDIHAVLDRPWVLRIVPLAYAIGAMAVTFRTARRCTGDLAAWFALIVLATTVPFFNFATQIRGYSLSMLLLVIMLDRLFRLEDAPRRRDVLVAAVAGTLALYTIPSNVYILAAVATFYMIAAACEARRTGLRLDNRYLRAAIVVPAALAAAALLYLPVWRSVLFNETVQSLGWFHGRALTTVLPTMLSYLLSGRYWLLVLITGAAALCMTAPVRTAEQSLRRRYLLCLAMLVLPFVYSAVRGDQPPDRIFVPVAPAFALLAAISAQLLCGRLAARPVAAHGALVLAILCSYASLAVSLRDIDRHLQADLRQGLKSQDSFYAYYQANYAPKQVVDELVARRKADPGPVFVFESADHPTMNIYLLRSRVAYLDVQRPDEMDFGDRGVAYLVTSWPHLAIQRLRDAYPAIHFQLLNHEPAFQGALVCRPVQAGAGQDPAAADPASAD